MLQKKEDQKVGRWEGERLRRLDGKKMRSNAGILELRDSGTPFADNGNNSFGSLWLVKDLKRDAISYYTLKSKSKEIELKVKTKTG